MLFIVSITHGLYQIDFPLRQAIGIYKKGLLFERSKSVPIQTRTYVPLLDANYPVYMTALYTLVADWLAEKIGTGQPTEPWELKMISEVNMNINFGEAGNQMDEDAKRVYDQLVKIKVPSHLRLATSHRKWLQKTLRFCEKVGIKFSDNMSSLIKIHDLSKYTHREVLGYAVMFGDGQKTFRVLENEDEKTEWQLALNNHYAANPHHPEYQGLPKNGIQSKTMTYSDTTYGRDYLEESVIDMLASHGERNLKNDSSFSVTKWMEINEKFMGRYEKGDRQFVRDIMCKWKQIATDYLSDEQNLEDMHGHFDDRPVSV